MNCFKCNKKIDEKKDHFFRFVEVLEGKEVGENQAHKECWDQVKSTIELKTKTQQVLDGVYDYFDRMGLVKKEYVVS